MERDDNFGVQVSSKQALELRLQVLLFPTHVVCHFWASLFRFKSALDMISFSA
jgi:hypothetical protein